MKKFAYHLIYWGLGAPFCVMVGFSIFIATAGLKNVIIENWQGVASCALGILCVIGFLAAAVTLLMAWIYAGLKLGYIKEQE